MLVLSRKVDEAILIGDDIRVIIVRIGSSVRIGIEAPDTVSIVREELSKSVSNLDKKEVA